MSEAARIDPIARQVSGLYQAPDFDLACGATLRPARLAWTRYGPEPARARAVVLLLHGISGSHQALRPPSGEIFPDAGWACAWLGNGALLDTRDTCVLVPNALGSCFGSSGPDGPQAHQFPPITISDSVKLQAKWLDSLGLSRLDAVIGYSYGGYQAFEWALTRPLAVDQVVVLTSAPRGNGTKEDVLKLSALAADLAAGKASAKYEWVAQRTATLRRYGYATWLRDMRERDPERRLLADAQAWARRFSPWALATLRQAAFTYDVRSALRSTPTPIHWMRCTSDDVFPPPGQGKDTEVPYPPQVRNIIVTGKYGHLSPLLEPHLWEPLLRYALKAQQRA